MGLNSDNNKLHGSSITDSNVYNVSNMDGGNWQNTISGDKRTMAEIIKLMWTSKVGQLFGSTLLGTWVFIDFNELKLMILGVMAMIWSCGYGLITLYRLYLKAKKEKVDLDAYIEEKKPKKLTDQTTNVHSIDT